MASSDFGRMLSVGAIRFEDRFECHYVPNFSLSLYFCITLVCQYFFQYRLFHIAWRFHTPRGRVAGALGENPITQVSSSILSY